MFTIELHFCLNSEVLFEKFSSICFFRSILPLNNNEKSIRPCLGIYGGIAALKCDYLWAMFPYKQLTG